MKSKLAFALIALLLSGLPARPQGTQDMPPDVRWRGNEALFFFVNSGDTTLFWHSFVRAAGRWQPGNFTKRVVTSATDNTPPDYPDISALGLTSAMVR